MCSICLVQVNLSLFCPLLHIHCAISGIFRRMHMQSKQYRRWITTEKIGQYNAKSIDQVWPCDDAKEINKFRILATNGRNGTHSNPKRMSETHSYRLHFSLTQFTWCDTVHWRSVCTLCTHNAADGKWHTLTRTIPAPIKKEAKEKKKRISNLELIRDDIISTG